MAPLFHDIAIYHLKISMFTPSREIVASNHHLKIVAACENTKSVKTCPAGFYPDIKMESKIRNVMSRFH